MDAVLREVDLCEKDRDGRKSLAAAQALTRALSLLHSSEMVREYILAPPDPAGDLSVLTCPSLLASAVTGNAAFISKGECYLDSFNMADWMFLPVKVGSGIVLGLTFCTEKRCPASDLADLRTALVRGNGEVSGRRVDEATCGRFAFLYSTGELLMYTHVPKSVIDSTVEGCIAIGAGIAGRPQPQLRERPRAGRVRWFSFTGALNGNASVRVVGARQSRLRAIVDHDLLMSGQYGACIIACCVSDGIVREACVTCSERVAKAKSQSPESGAVVPEAVGCSCREEQCPAPSSVRDFPSATRSMKCLGGLWSGPTLCLAAFPGLQVPFAASQSLYMNMSFDRDTDLVGRMQRMGISYASNSVALTRASFPGPAVTGSLSWGCRGPGVTTPSALVSRDARIETEVTTRRTRSPHSSQYHAGMNPTQATPQSVATWQPSAVVQESVTSERIVPALHAGDISPKYYRPVAEQVPTSSDCRSSPEPLLYSQSRMDAHAHSDFGVHGQSSADVQVHSIRDDQGPYSARVQQSIPENNILTSYPQCDLGSHAQFHFGSHGPSHVDVGGGEGTARWQHCDAPSQSLEPARVRRDPDNFGPHRLTRRNVINTAIVQPAEAHCQKVGGNFEDGQESEDLGTTVQNYRQQCAGQGRVNGRFAKKYVTEEEREQARVERARKNRESALRSNATRREKFKTLQSDIQRARAEEDRLRSFESDLRKANLVLRRRLRARQSK